MISTQRRRDAKGTKKDIVGFVLYIEMALKQAEYQRDEDGVVIAAVPGSSGFFAQGDSFEEARDNLRDVIEGSIIFALQLGLPIPCITGVVIEEQDIEAVTSGGFYACSAN